MQRSSYSRRTVLGVAAALSLGGVGLAQSQDTDDADVTRESFRIMEGTDHETTVYEIRAEVDGPTVLLVGGIHGDEEAGWVAANEITEWTIDAGTLVTIPEANPTAIEQGTRRGADGENLNRMFPTNEDPQTDLAQEIWHVVEEYEPDAVIDLHESTGIYAGDPIDGVGQAIFHSPGNDATEAADRAIEYVNEYHVDDPELEFMAGGFTGPDTEPEGLLVHKVERETDGIAFLVETLRTEIDLETRVEWQTIIVQQLALGMLFGEVEEPDVDADEDVEEGEEADVHEEEEEDEPEAVEGPTANITTTPEDAVDTTLELDQTIELHAGESSPGTNVIESYEWDVDEEGEFTKTGETIEVTVSACGAFPVVLRVTDEDGRSDLDEITLKTD